MCEKCFHYPQRTQLRHWVPPRVPLIGSGASLPSGFEWYQASLRLSHPRKENKIYQELYFEPSRQLFGHYRKEFQLTFMISKICLCMEWKSTKHAFYVWIESSKNCFCWNLERPWNIVTLYVEVYNVWTHLRLLTIETYSLNLETTKKMFSFIWRSFSSCGCKNNVLFDNWTPKQLWLLWSICGLKMKLDL